MSRATRFGAGRHRAPDAGRHGLHRYPDPDVPARGGVAPRPGDAPRGRRQPRRTPGTPGHGHDRPVRGLGRASSAAGTRKPVAPGWRSTSTGWWPASPTAPPPAAVTRPRGHAASSPCPSPRTGTPRCAVEEFATRFRAADYNPAWLLVGDRTSLYALDMTGAGDGRPRVEELGPGVHILENNPLHTRSPKEAHVRELLGDLARSGCPGRSAGAVRARGPQRPGSGRRGRQQRRLRERASAADTGGVRAHRHLRHAVIDGGERPGGDGRTSARPRGRRAPLHVGLRRRDRSLRGLSAAVAGAAVAGAGGRARRDYLPSQLFLACFCSACFWCLAALFSLRLRPGFFASADGRDFSAMPAAYDGEAPRGVTRPHP